ncbi:MAG: bacillithiol biosynthesis cysteine-adding enzyme BshC [Candidatus Acidiferrales bacterium]
MAASMESHCIPAAQLPQTTRLYRAFLEDFPSVTDFYAHIPTLEGAREAASQIHYEPAMRAAVVERLRAQNASFGSGATVERNLDRLAGGAVAVVTGQQVTLFSGPAYTFHKALTAVRVAAELSASGVDAVPIFWLAAEDHDLAEINHCLWRGREGNERLELEQVADENENEIDSDGPSVGTLKLGDAVEEIVARATNNLEGPSAEQIAAALRDSYRSEATYSSALGKLLARLLGPLGLILLDPLDAELHRLAAPVYLRALDEHATLSEELLHRAERLERHRFHAQVKVTERSTLLFWSAGGHRMPVRRKNAGFAVGDRDLSAGDLRREIEAAPEAFSGNVLLRPIVQDTLLPTAAYIAGPAETAYYAQASVVYQRLLGRMPAILPRASITLVPAHVARLLEKYNLQVSDTFHGARVLREQMERDTLPKSLATRFKSGETSLKKILAGLRAPIEKLDRTLIGALETAESKMLHQFQSLEQKAGRAQALRSGVLEAHEHEIAGVLFPEGELQERALCLLPLLASQGLDLLDNIAAQITPGSPQHQLLFL